MPALNIRRVCLVVREFFEEHKKTEFYFDVVNVDLIEGEWEVECQVSNDAGAEGSSYLVRVSDATGDITYVSMQQSSGSDDDDDDDEEESAEGGGGSLGTDPGPGRWH